MTPAARDWLNGLRRFSEEHRATQAPLVAAVPSETGSKRSPPAHGDSAAAIGAQGAIIANKCAAWGLSTLLDLAAARPDAVIAVTTSAPGLEAIARMVASLPEPIIGRVAIATEMEYRFWCMRAPDEAHRLHMMLWSWIKAPLPRQRRGDYPRHPIADTASYWLLRYGHEGHGAPWRSADLYSWDGAVAALLATGIAERIRSRG